MNKSMDRIRRLAWDSAFFGMPLGLLRGHHLNALAARKALQEARHKKLCGFYFLAAPEPTTIAAAEASAFQLMDVRVALKASIKKTLSRRLWGSLPQGMRVRAAQIQDIPALKKMASSTHRDSRFISDAHFPRTAGPRLFAEWIARSIHGQFDDQVYVASFHANIAGYISLRNDGRIGLLGVAAAWKRQGVGSALLRQGFQWFNQLGLDTATVVTQGANQKALVFYQCRGFYIEDVSLWYHRWL